MPELLKIYLESGDYTEQIRRMLLDEIAEMRAVDYGIIREHIFNQFIIVMDSEKDEVLIADDLMIYEPDEATVTIDEFARALERTNSDARP